MKNARPLTDECEWIDVVVMVAHHAIVPFDVAMGKWVIAGCHCVVVVVGRTNGKMRGRGIDGYMNVRMYML